MSPESPDITVTLTARMNAPSFSAGSTVSATITLQAYPSNSAASPASIHSANATAESISRSHSSPPSHSAASSPSRPFSPSPAARATYVVAEFSGRWTTDRSWVVPHAHPPTDPSFHLDDHAQSPAAPPNNSHSATSSPLPPPPADPTFGPYPWSPALADANAVGGGGRPGHVGTIFRSRPLVVCEREQIATGSAVTFAVSCVLPDALPPTLRGTAVRYTYAVTVVAHFPPSVAPRVVRVPFRVVPLASPTPTFPLAPVPTPRDVGPRPNRFLQDARATALAMQARLLKSAPPDDIQIALALSLNGRLTAYRADVNARGGDPAIVTDHSLHNSSAFGLSPASAATAADRVPPSLGAVTRPDGTAKYEKIVAKVYAITRGRDPVARVQLTNEIHYLGENVTALFSLDASGRCYRIGARLEMQEIVQGRSAVGLKGSGAKNDGGEAGRNVVFRKVYGEHGEFVMGNRNSQVTFSIPFDAAASLRTEVVAVQWLLDFVFVVAKGKTWRPTNGVTTEHEQAKTAEEEEAEEAAALMGHARQAVEVIKGAEGDDDDDEVEDGDEGWVGGSWAGEQPRNWRHLPSDEVEVLRWTLPIAVGGLRGSQWGSRGVGRIVHTANF